MPGSIFFFFTTPPCLRFSSWHGLMLPLALTSISYYIHETSLSDYSFLSTVAFSLYFSLFLSLGPNVVLPFVYLYTYQGVLYNAAPCGINISIYGVVCLPTSIISLHIHISKYILNSKNLPTLRKELSVTCSKVWQKRRSK